VQELVEAAVLIDGGYLSKIVLKFFYPAKIDLLKFSNNLCYDCNRIRTIYYDCMPYQSGRPTFEERNRYAKAHKFITALQALDKFTVKLGNLLKKEDGSFEQKGVDVEFALDLTVLALSEEIKVAYIISGDSDFVPAVKRANSVGINTINVHHSEEFSYHLRDICVENRIIDQHLIDNSLLTYKTPKKSY